jgi:D-3-phosphoglycerate dehydrogenase
MIKIVKAGRGLDPENIVARRLGAGFEVVEYDPGRPLEDQVGEASALLLRDQPITRRVMDAAPRLKLLQRYGQHVVGVDFAHARALRIPVANIPTSVTGADRIVAEHALYLMLAVARQMRLAQASLADRILGAPKVRGLSGKTLGLVGVGNTGSELVRLVRGFGMRTIAVKRTPDHELAAALGLSFLGDMSRLDDVLGGADYVSLHLPLDASTRGFFDGRCFAAMKPGAVLINIARGAVVDQPALLRALRDGRLGGAGLDVLQEEPVDPLDPLLQFTNVVVTPHHAGVTDEIADKASAVVAENVRRVLSGEPPLYVVDGDGVQRQH